MKPEDWQFLINVVAAGLFFFVLAVCMAVYGA